jgi:deazaflavin-dependent oxidoreductase (nitroreductase family)
MPGGAIVVLTHRGRRTGRLHRTPVEAIVDDPERGEVIVLPAGGERSDWCRNVMAGGLVQVRLRGESHAPVWRRLSEDESRAALDRYIKAHPRWGPAIVGGLARRHRLTGEPIPAVAGALPLLALGATEPDPGSATQAG